MLCASSKNWQNWFWPDWPNLWIGSPSSPGPTCKEEIVREFYVLKMVAGSSQTCGEYNRFIPKFCALFWWRGRLLILKCLTKVLISKLYFITALGNKKKLVTWSSKSTKLFISLWQEKTDLFENGKVWRKVVWDKVAEQFNANSSVRVPGEQCTSKWKKLKEKF